MAKASMLILAVVLVFSIDLASSQRGRPPPLPPTRRPVPPLLPLVPSQEFTDRLTQAQLAFIRHHQAIQENDKTNYTPYACLPKYICIVDDEKGNKRTAVVNGLHPILRESTLRGPQNLRDGIPNLSITDPEAFYKNQVRLTNDEFLKDQEFGEKIALEQQKRREQFLLQQEQKKQDDSVEESNEESNEEDIPDSSERDQGPSGQGEMSPLRRTKRPGQFQGPQEDGPAPAHQENGPINHIPNGPRPGLVNKIKSVFLKPIVVQGAPMPHFDKDSAEGYSQAANAPQRPQRGILRRMLGFRRKRDTRAQPQPKPMITKLGPGIKSSDQCRVLYNGCDLQYDQIMQIASEGQVLIEGDDPLPKLTKKPMGKPIKPEDDEADQAAKDKPTKAPLRPNLPGPFKPFHPPKSKPGMGFYKIKQMKGSKYGNSYSEFNKNNEKPVHKHPQDDEVDNIPVASLPVLPMRFTWGKPEFYTNGGPPVPIFGDLDSRNPIPETTPFPKPFVSTSPAPIFVKKPIFKKFNRTITQTNIIKLNSTHALEIKTPKSKPYRPNTATVLDNNGNPASFASVFTEIAGSSGGIYDYFDKIANSIGGPPNRRTQKQFPRPTAAPVKAKESKEVDGDDDQSEEDEDDQDQEDEGQGQGQGQGPEGQDDESDEEEEEEDETEAIADDIDVPVEPKPAQKNKKNKYTLNRNKDKKKQKNKGGDEVQDDEAQDDDKDTSEEKRKRIKAAEEVELPDFLPDHIKQGIKDDIMNPGKNQGPEEEEGAQNDEGQDDYEGGPGQGQGQGPPGQGQPQPHHGGGGRPGGPPGGRPGGPPGPPPRGGGLFSSLFRRPVNMKMY